MRVPSLAPLPALSLSFQCVGYNVDQTTSCSWHQDISFPPLWTLLKVQAKTTYSLSCFCSECFTTTWRCKLEPPRFMCSVYLVFSLKGYWEIWEMGPGWRKWVSGSMPLNVASCPLTPAVSHCFLDVMMSVAFSATDSHRFVTSSSPQTANNGSSGPKPLLKPQAPNKSPHTYVRYLVTSMRN